jgi:hypothetical protein
MSCRKCMSKRQQKFGISDTELKDLVWQMPVLQIAKNHKVSCNAIIHRCRRRKFSTPPRGYWAKLRAGKIASHKF